MDRGDLAQLTQWPMTCPETSTKHCLPPTPIPSFRCQAHETIAINVGISLGAMP